MKLYQKVSILAVVGALSFSGNVVKADDMDDAVESFHKAAEYDVDGSKVCTVCNLVKKLVGEKTDSKLCTSGGSLSCAKDIGTQIAPQIKKASKATLNKVICPSAVANEKSLCGLPEKYKSSNPISANYWIAQGAKAVLSSLKSKCPEDHKFECKK